MPGRTEFTDERLKDHIDTFQDKPAAKFGSQHALDDLAAEFRDKLSQLLKRLQALEEKVG